MSFKDIYGLEFTYKIDGKKVRRMFCFTNKKHAYYLRDMMLDNVNPHIFVMSLHDDLNDSLIRTFIIQSLLY